MALRSAATVAPAIVVASTVMATLESVFLRLLEQDASQGQILLYRAGMQLLLVLLICSVRSGGIGIAVRTRRLRQHLLRGALAAVSWWCYFMSFKTLTLPLATTLTFSSQLFVLLLAWPMLRERVTRAQLLATLTGFAGVLVAARVFTPAVPDWNVGYGLASAFMGAVMLLITRSLSFTDRTETILFYMALVVFLSAIPQSLLDWRPLELRATLLLVAMALTGTLGAWWMVEAYRRAEASALAPYMYARLVFAALLGYVIFGERVAQTTVIGAALIVGSTLGLWWFNRRRMQPRSRAS
jgi:drug/metabolite transporter (DMT)-like permease